MSIRHTAIVDELPAQFSSSRLAYVLRVGLRESSFTRIGTNTEVRTVSNSVGQGLFATRSISVGTTVAEMIDQSRMRRNAYEIYRENLGLPHDSCIFVAGSPLVFYDRAWTERDLPPLWYRQNHSPPGLNANVKMVIENLGAPPRQQRLVWKANRSIEPGDQLRFTYTDVPNWWNTSSICG